MVDLNLAQRGYKMRLRCGGQIEWPFNKYDATRWNLHGLSYEANGSVVTSKASRDIEEHPFDIVEVIPPEFDWSTVKTGDAFIWSPPAHIRVYKGLVRYIGIAPHTGYMVFETTNGQGETALNWLPRKDDLERAPEHDIEVK